MQDIIWITKDSTASASNESLDGNDTAKVLANKGKPVLAGMYVCAEATADVHRVTLKSPSMSGGDKPFDFPVMCAAGGVTGPQYISFGPGQTLTPDEIITVGAYNADGANACFTAVGLDIRYNESEYPGGQIACYRITPTADVTARVLTVQDDVLTGKLLPKDYHVLAAGYHGEQADSVWPYGFKLECAEFDGMKPGAAGTLLPENSVFYYWWSQARGLANCPKFRGTSNMKVWHLADAATKPVLYILLHTM